MPPEAVIDSAVSSTATVEMPAEQQDYSAYMRSLSPSERQQLALTGNEPESKPFKQAEPVKAPATPQTPAPAKAKAEPPAGDGADDQDQEPEYYGTPEQIAKQKHAFARKSRQLAEAKAELKLLREQRAEKPAVTATAPKAEPKAQPSNVEPDLDLPDINKYGDSPAEIARYQADQKAAIKKYNREMAAYDKRVDAEASESQKASESQRDRASQWSRDIEASKEAHEDFEAVAFSPKVFVSLPTIGVLMGMKGGSEVLYQIGKNPDIEKELLAETDIPGNYQTYEELAEAAESNPKLARDLAAAEAIVRHEAKKILAGTVAKKKDPEPKPIIQTRAPGPGTRVNPQAAATGDPIADAYARGDYAAGAKLEAARDVENSRKRN